MASAEEFLERARALLQEGTFEEARAVLDEGIAVHGEDARLRDLYEGVHLALGIRLAAEAREMRRREIEARGAPGEAFEDSEAARASFEDALAAFNRVLAVNPGHVKALTLKAQTMFRLDRGNRDAALDLYAEATRALDAAGGPEREAGRRNLLRDRRQIEMPCEWCDDTGFCTECGGAGWKTTLRIRRKCDACLGHGVCRRCGVL